MVARHSGREHDSARLGGRTATRRRIQFNDIRRRKEAGFAGGIAAEPPLGRHLGKHIDALALGKRNTIGFGGNKFKLADRLFLRFGQIDQNDFDKKKKKKKKVRQKKKKEGELVDLTNAKISK
jgi:hypothetical protein